jgi:hypothetical protein
MKVDFSGNLRFMLCGLLTSLIVGCASAPPSMADNRPELKIIDRFDLPCKSVNNKIIFSNNTFISMSDGCRVGVVQKSLFVRHYKNLTSAIAEQSLILPGLLMSSPLEGGNQDRTWVDKEGGLNWLAPSRDLNCLAHYRIKNPVGASNFTNSSRSCLIDEKGFSGNKISFWAKLVYLSDGALFLYDDGRQGIIFIETNGQYKPTKLIAPKVVHQPSFYNEKIDSVKTCQESRPEFLVCQVVFSSETPTFYSKSRNDVTGVGLLDFKTNLFETRYVRGDVAFDRIVAAPNGVFVTTTNGGPRQLAWTAFNSLGSLIYNDMNDIRGLVAIKNGPEWGYGVPAFSPDGSILYSIRSDHELDIFTTKPFILKASLYVTKIGLRSIGFVAVDNTSGYVAICNDKKCVILEGWQ